MSISFRSRLLTLALAGASLLPAARPSIACDLPVTAALPDGRVLRGLGRQDFHLRVGGKSLAANTTPDAGPRRILLLLDLSRQINDDAWKAMLATAAHIVQNAREQDRLALLTFGGHHEYSDFQQSRRALREKLALLESRPPAGRSVLVRDGLAEAVAAFDRPLYGDAILVMFGGEDDGSRISPERLRKLLESNPIRVFGISFGVMTRGTIMPVITGSELTYNVFEGNDFNEMVVGTGGVILIGDSGHPWKTYQLTEEHQNQLRTSAWRIYGQIVETYRLTAPVPRPGKAEDVAIQLSKAVTQRFPKAVVRTVRKLQTCPGAARHEP